MPPWTAMPFTIEPIACSRMPKARLRPDQRADEEAAALELVLVDSTRSAAPPTIVGADGERLHHALPGVARRDLLAGRERRQRIPSPVAAAGRACVPRPRARPGTRAAQRVEARLPLGLELAARARRRLSARAPRRGRGTCASGSQPSASFVARTSSSPSGAPCAFAVSTACGAPKPMCVRTTIIDGRAVSACAARDRVARARRGRSRPRRAGRASPAPRSARPGPRP